METSPSHRAPAFDVTRRYVRLRQRRADGFVEFDFALGDPALSVELILPAAGFEAFCRVPGTCTISDAEAALIAAREQAYLRGPAWLMDDDGESVPASHPIHSTTQETRA